MSLRVGVNARTFTESQPGGAVQAAEKSTQALIDHTDLEVVLFGHPSLRERFSEPPVVSSYYAHDSQEFGVVWERTVLPRLARRGAVDVLYCPNGNGPLTSQPSVSVVTCIHDVSAINGYSNGMHGLYRRATIPRVARLSDRVVTVSEFTRDALLSETELSTADVEVIHNGIDDYFRADGVGDPVDLPEQYLLFVGSLNPRKNISRLVDAFHQFRANSSSEHKLVFVGPGNKRVFKTLDIPADDSIVTPGFLSREQLKFAYCNADLFVYPSLYEGFGLPPLEAMACGTPVVVSGVTALPEVIGEAAEFVDPHDIDAIASGIELVLGDETYRDELVTLGRQRATQFRWKAVGEQLSTVVKNTA